ncbi:hypothetical protein SANTM175S_03651 [Streptomyces antimycoticus]
MINAVDEALLHRPSTRKMDARVIPMPWAAWSRPTWAPVALLAPQCVASPDVEVKGADYPAPGILEYSIGVGSSHQNSEEW